LVKPACKKKEEKALLGFVVSAENYDVARFLSQLVWEKLEEVVARKKVKVVVRK